MTTPKNEALAAYLAACRERWKEVARMHAELGTYETAKRTGLSRQRVQQIVQRWKREQAEKESK